MLFLFQWLPATSQRLQSFSAGCRGEVEKDSTSCKQPTALFWLPRGWPIWLFSTSLTYKLWTETNFLGSENFNFYVRGKFRASALQPLPVSDARKPENTRVSHWMPTHPWRPARLSDAKNTPRPRRMMGYVTRIKSGNLLYDDGWVREKEGWRIQSRTKRGGSWIISWCVFLHWDRCDGFSRCVFTQTSIIYHSGLLQLHPIKKENRFPHQVQGLNEFCF